MMYSVERLRPYGVQITVFCWNLIMDQKMSIKKLKNVLGWKLEG
jgi:hypothetical protein